MRLTIHGTGTPQKASELPCALILGDQRADRGAEGKLGRENKRRRRGAVRKGRRRKGRFNPPPPPPASHLAPVSRTPYDLSSVMLCPAVRTTSGKFLSRHSYYRRRSPACRWEVIKRLRSSPLKSPEKVRWPAWRRWMTSNPATGSQTCLHERRQTVRASTLATRNRDWQSAPWPGTWRSQSTTKPSLLFSGKEWVL